MDNKKIFDCVKSQIPLYSIMLNNMTKVVSDAKCKTLNVNIPPAMIVQASRSTATTARRVRMFLAFHLCSVIFFCVSRWISQAHNI